MYSRTFNEKKYFNYALSNENLINETKKLPATNSKDMAQSYALLAALRWVAKNDNKKFLICTDSLYTLEILSNLNKKAINELTQNVLDLCCLLAKRNDEYKVIILATPSSKILIKNTVPIRISPETCSTNKIKLRIPTLHYKVKKQWFNLIFEL